MTNPIGLYGVGLVLCASICSFHYTSFKLQNVSLEMKYQQQNGNNIWERDKVLYLAKNIVKLE